MSKKNWRLVGWYFLVLSLFAVLSLAAVDFLELPQAALRSKVGTGKNPSSQAAFKQHYIPRTPILVTTSQHPTKKIKAISGCLQSR